MIQLKNVNMPSKNMRTKLKRYLKCLHAPECIINFRYFSQHICAIWRQLIQNRPHDINLWIFVLNWKWASSVIGVHNIENCCLWNVQKEPTKMYKEFELISLSLTFSYKKPPPNVKPNNKSTWKHNTLSFLRYVVTFSRICFSIFFLLNHVARYFQVTFVALISLLFSYIPGEKRVKKNIDGENERKKRKQTTHTTKCRDLLAAIRNHSSFWPGLHCYWQLNSDTMNYGENARWVRV